LSRNSSSSRELSMCALLAARYSLNNSATSQARGCRHLEVQGVQSDIRWRSLRVCHQRGHHSQGDHDPTQKAKIITEGTQGRREGDQEGQEVKESSQTQEGMICSYLTFYYICISLSFLSLNNKARQSLGNRILEMRRLGITIPIFLFLAFFLFIL
jgi:hypothetical protein